MEEKKLTISRAARLLGVTTHVLKKWEGEFSAFLTVLRDQDNARVYTEESMDILRLIKEMKEQGMHEAIIQKELKQLKEECQQQAEEIDPEAIPEVYSVSAMLKKIEQYLIEKEKEEWTHLESRFKHLEKSLVEQIHEVMSSKVEVATSSEIEMIQKDQPEPEEKCALEGQTMTEERERARKNIEKREEQFIAFVQKHHRRKEEKMKEKKSKRSILKNIMEFSK